MKQRRWVAALLFLLFQAMSLLPGTPPGLAQEQGPIYSIKVDGIITTMSGLYVQRALRQAEASNATALIIELGSEGAVLRQMRPLAGKLAEAEVPVVVYVSPQGTRSGAAGAFLLSAAHISAMSPNTSFGTPFQLARVEQALTEQTQNLVLDSVTTQLRKWNKERGRSAAWVDRAIREGVILTNEQASATTPPSIDLVAQDMAELLILLEGRSVELENGQRHQLHTLGREPITLAPSLWERFLLMLTNPTIVFMLLVMGFVALYAELVQPGIGIFAGLSAVLLLAALVGLIVLPIRLISLAGLALAFALIALDIFVPTHGGLTVIGLGLLVVSALTLIDTTQAPEVYIALWAIALVVLAVASVAALVIWLIINLRRRQVTTGEEGLVGRVAEVRKRLDPEGLVFVEGALWRAICEDGAVEQGEWVRVVATRDLRLFVKQIEPETRFSTSKEEQFQP